jgi:hypothetical protein
MEHMEGYWESIFGEQKDLGSVGDAFIDMFKFGLIVALVGTLVGSAFGFGWACLGLLIGAIAGGWFGLDRYSDHSIRAKLARPGPSRKGTVIISLWAVALVNSLLVVCGVAPISENVAVAVMLTASMSAGFFGGAAWLKYGSSVSMRKFLIGVTAWSAMMTVAFAATAWLGDSNEVGFFVALMSNIILWLVWPLSD